jgi:hypothetical protein
MWDEKRRIHDTRCMIQGEGQIRNSNHEVHEGRHEGHEAKKRGQVSTFNTREVLLWNVMLNIET